MAPGRMDGAGDCMQAAGPRSTFSVSWRSAAAQGAALLVMAGALSACESTPMRVEQRYYEPPTQQELLQQQIEASRRMQRSHI